MITKPMNRFAFDMMALTFRIRDLLKPPERVLARADLQPGMTVIDYGCGPGSYTLAAARLVGASGQVYGLDIHPQAVHSVKTRASRQSLPNVEGVLVHGYVTGLPDATADRVLLMDMIHMVPDQDVLLAEVTRLLKPGGRLFVQVHHMSPEPIKALLAAQNYTIVQQWDEELLVARAG